MKRLAMFSLAAIAVMALTIAIGGGSASAVTLCKVKASDTCPAAETYPAGTKISANVTKAGSVLTTSLGNITCTSSSFAGETAAESGNPLGGDIQSLTFTNCSLGSTPCTFTSEHLPYTSTGSASSTTGNGTVVVESAGSGTPQVHMECGSAWACIFAKKSTSMTVTGGNPATAVANQSMELIENEGFFCPSTATWEASYEITSPKPLFIVASP